MSRGSCPMTWLWRRGRPRSGASWPAVSGSGLCIFSRLGEIGTFSDFFQEIWILEFLRNLQSSSWLFVVRIYRQPCDRGHLETDQDLNEFHQLAVQSQSNKSEGFKSLIIRYSYWGSNVIKIKISFEILNSENNEKKWRDCPEVIFVI